MITSVDASVFRGSRPRPDQYSMLRAVVKSVVSLEGIAEDQREANGLAPLQVASCPILFAEIYFTGIAQIYLDKILEIIDSAPKPVLVHCEHGEDRTGLVVAAYRVRVSRWVKDAAMAEALRFGYRRWLNYGLNKTWGAFQ